MCGLFCSGIVKKCENIPVFAGAMSSSLFVLHARVYDVYLCPRDFCDSKSSKNRRVYFDTPIELTIMSTDVDDMTARLLMSAQLALHFLADSFATVLLISWYC